MRQCVVRAFMIATKGFGLMVTALFSSVAVSADPPPSIFTNNGCVVGNYACLQDAVGTNNPWPYYGGIPFTGMYGYPPFVGSPYVAPGYVVPAIPAVGSLNATIVSGTTSVSPGTVRVAQLVSLGVGGFTSGENVIATVTPTGGQATQIGPAAAATDGTVTVTLTFPSADGWQVVVHGQTSNKTVTYQFTAQ